MSVLLFALVAWLPALALAEPASAAVMTPPDAGQGNSVGKGKLGGDAPFGSFSLQNHNQPINVRSDRLEFSYRERLLTYTGQVVVTQGDLTLRSDVLKVTLSQDQNTDRLEQIIAIGGVSITQGNRTATGGKAVFNQHDRTIELSDGAVLTEGPNKISGDRVLVYLDEERSVVEGGDRRVQALLYPGEGIDATGAKGDPKTP